MKSRKIKSKYKKCCQRQDRKLRYKSRLGVTVIVTTLNDEKECLEIPFIKFLNEVYEHES